MRVGIISGSGTYDWPDLAADRRESVSTRYGEVEVGLGEVAGVEVVHLSRHGPGHARLSHQVMHKANLAALLACEVQAMYSLTVCGALDPGLAPGTLVVFDDLYFPANRLPDGSPCTWHEKPGTPDRGHWIFPGPFAEALRAAALDGAGVAGVPTAPAGCYGHVDGPRFNSRAEVAALAVAGVTAISQTAGPEVVLAGEAELPMALLGFVTDHANGAAPPGPPASVSELSRLIAVSRETFAAVLAEALPALAGDAPVAPAGFVYRFGP